jgi:hypothetical protein
MKIWVQDLHLLVMVDKQKTNLVQLAYVLPMQFILSFTFHLVGWVGGEVFLVGRVIMGLGGRV